MGLFDLFTESGRTFNWLFDNYFDATEMAYQAKLGQNEGRLSSKRLTRNIPTEDKAWLAEQENSILEIDRCIKDDRKKQEIIDVAKIFKRAFLYFCKKEGISPSFFFSMDGRPSMPGETEFKSFRPLSSFSAKSYERPLSPLKALSFWDKHFQGLVEEALDEYGYKPKFAYENNTISIKKRVIDLAHRFCNTEGHVGELISLLERTTPQFPYGIRFLYYNKLSVDRSVGHELISAMYQHISEFENLEKAITTLVERETLWKQFEDQILANDLRRYYYRCYFKDKYGKEQVSLDKYEAIVNDFDLFNAYIQRLEAGYDSLKQKYPFGLEEFEKQNPDIPHTEYPKYSSSIAWLEEKSLSFLFCNRQAKLTHILADTVSNLSGWDAFIKTIEVQCEDYDLNSFTSPTSRAFIYKYLTYGDNYTMTEYERYYEIDKSRFKYCSDIFNTRATKNLAEWDSKEVLNELNSVLTNVIPAYLDIFRNLRIVLAGDMWNYLGDEKRAKSQVRCLPALGEYNSRIDVIINYEFDERAAWLPHLFLTLETSPDVLDAAAPNHILSSFVSISLGIDYEELTKIEEKRSKEHRARQLDELNSLKRTNPFGFSSWCMDKFGSDDVDSLPYDEVIQSKREIIGCQRNEEARVREQKRKEAENIEIQKGIRLSQLYPAALKELFPSIGAVSTLSDAKFVIKAEDQLKQYDILFCKRDELFVHQRTVHGLPHKYFWDYFSKRKYGECVTPEAERNRQVIWLFKDGRITKQPIEMVSKFLKGSKINSYASNITFVCIPASNQYDNTNRYADFSSGVCSALGFRNGFPHIRVTSDVTPRRMGGTRRPELELDHIFFRDSYVLLFDDVVTSGSTVCFMKNLLEEVGAHCIGVISLGKTV